MARKPILIGLHIVPVPLARLDLAGLKREAVRSRPPDGFSRESVVTKRDTARWLCGGVNGLRSIPAIHGATPTLIRPFVWATDAVCRVLPAAEAPKRYGRQGTPQHTVSFVHALVTDAASADLHMQAISPRWKSRSVSM